MQQQQQRRRKQPPPPRLLSFSSLLLLVAVAAILLHHSSSSSSNHPAAAHFASATTTYYFSTSDGTDDGSNTGTSPTDPFATPWTAFRSLAISIHDGDVLRFKRGDTFRGSIPGGPNTFNSYAANLTFESYGGNPATDPKPVIAGSIIIHGPWSSLGSNLWRSAPIVLPRNGNSEKCGNGPEQPNQNIIHLFRNGQLLRIARFPNEGSYLQIDSSTGNNNFQSSGLAGRPANYYSGANARVRTFSWHWQTGIVDSSSGDGGLTLTNYLQNDGQGSTLLPEWGFYLDNKEEFLDNEGEWWLDSGSSSILIFSSSNPNSDVFEGMYSGFTTGFCIFWTSDITIRDFHFKHQAENGISIWGAERVIVTDCTQEYSARHGLNILWTRSADEYGAADILVENNTFSYNFDHGGKTNAPSSDQDWGSTAIRNNVFLESGTIAGYGRPPYDTGSFNMGFRANGGATYIHVFENVIDGSGRGGASLDGAVDFQRNIVARACLTHNDCSGIVFNHDDLIVKQNFIRDTYGDMTTSGLHSNGGALPRMSWGLRSHLRNNHATIEGNVVYCNQAEGILVEGTDNHVITNNVWFNNGNPERGRRQIALEGSTGTSVSNNIEVSLRSDVRAGTYLDSMQGTFFHNSYCNPFNKEIFEIGSEVYTFDEWKSSREGNAVGCPPSMPLYDPGQIGEKVLLKVNPYPDEIITFTVTGEWWDMVTEALVSDNFQLFPFTGAVLFLISEQGSVSDPIAEDCPEGDPRCETTSDPHRGGTSGVGIAVAIVVVLSLVGGTVIFAFVFVKYFDGKNKTMQMFNNLKLKVKK